MHVTRRDDQMMIDRGNEDAALDLMAVDRKRNREMTDSSQNAGEVTGTLR
jgi:hypothetical protein